jgi:uncharacterized RDD family membrane protein YckC
MRARTPVTSEVLAVDTDAELAVRTATTDRPQSPYAGIASRVAALAVDVALLTTAALTISVLPSVAWREVIGTSPGWLGALSGTVAAVLPWMYFTLSWWWSGQTVGDILVGIAVRGNLGDRVSLIQAALRAAFGLAVAPLWLVGLLGILWDGRRRAWHDVLFRTAVYRVTRRDPGRDPAGSGAVSR